MFCVVSMHMDILKSFYKSLWSRIRQVKPSNQEARKSVCQRDIAIKQKRWRQMMMGKINRVSAKHLYLFPFFKKTIVYEFISKCFLVSFFSIFLSISYFFLDSFSVFIPWSSVFFFLLHCSWSPVKLDLGRRNYLRKCQRVTVKRHIFAHSTGNVFNSTQIESKILRYRKVIKEILLLSALQSLNYHYDK